MIKQEGLYQNKVTLSLASIYNDLNDDFFSNPFLIFLVRRFILVIVSLILTVLSTVQTEDKNFQDILHVPVLVVVSC